MQISTYDKVTDGIWGRYEKSKNMPFMSIFDIANFTTNEHRHVSIHKRRTLYNPPPLRQECEKAMHFI